MAGWQNPGMFPVGYQPAQIYPQQPFQQFQQPPVQTRAIEAVPVDNEDQVRTWPVNVGATVLFMAKDDSFVAFKTHDIKGEVPPVFYDLRPPAPEAPAPDFLTRKEAEEMIAAALAAKRTPKKEAAEA